MDLNMTKNLGRARFVKKAREERVWTQSHLADAAKVNLRTIQRLEKDGSASFGTLMSVAGALDVDVQQLSPTSKTQEKSEPQKTLYLLPRMTSGQDLARIINGADLFQIEHDETDDKRAQKAMVAVLEAFKGDLVRWHDSDLTGKLKMEFKISQEIKELEAHGFYLFGVKREIPQVVEDETTRILMCTIYMSHSRSPKIVRDKKSNMVIPAMLTEVVR